MPPERAGFGTPEHWLRYARADLALARGPLPEGGIYELLCYHAQQAAEKSLKAVLVAADIDIPYTHNPTRVALARTPSQLATPARRSHLRKRITERPFVWPRP